MGVVCAIYRRHGNGERKLPLVPVLRATVRIGSEVINSGVGLWTDYSSSGRHG